MASDKFDNLPHAGIASGPHDISKAASSKASNGSSFLLPFTREVLSNGLTLLIKEVHSLPIVSVQFWARTGSANETEENCGISHFLEHMFFKGTEKRGVGEMDRIIKELGGYNNAFTSFEYTGYLVVLPSENFLVALDVLYDALRNSVFDPAEIEKERQVVKEEINRSEDDPESKLFWEFTAKIFEGTPYQSPVLGTPQSLDRITRESFIKYIKDYYVPNNMVTVVVGDVNTPEVIEHLKRATADFAPDPTVAKRFPSFTFAPDSAPVVSTIRKDVAQTYLALGYPTRGRSSMSDIYPLDVAAVILGGSRSSRLYDRLLEREGIVGSIEATAWDLARAGSFSIEASFKMENLSRVKEEIFEEVDKLLRGDISPDELARAKTIIRSAFAFKNESVNALATTLGSFETLQRVEEAVEYVDKIERVTVDQVKEVLSRYVGGKSYVLCAIVPEDGAESGSREE